MVSSLRQGFLVILMTLVLIGAGTRSLDRLPVDAYPDLSPPIVRDHHRAVAGTRRRGGRAAHHGARRAADERHSAAGRDDSLFNLAVPGLSDVILTFHNGTDNYFAPANRRSIG